MNAWREQPLFFDHAGARLYGMFYPAQRSITPRRGLVICPAIGAEADLSSAVMVQFARCAAAAGLEVFRFDYRGCGESEGAFEDATLEEWLDDVHGAVRYFQHHAAVDTVGMLGLRLGGTVALLAASRTPAVEWVCLWEPVLVPHVFVDELLQQQFLAHNLWTDRPLKDRRELLILNGRGVELLGYCWRKETVEALTRLDVLSALHSVGVPSLIVHLGSGRSKRCRALREALQERGIPSELLEVDTEIFWQKSSRPDLDLLKLRRQDALVHHTLGWITLQARLPSHA